MTRDLFAGRALRDAGILHVTRNVAVRDLIEACRRWALSFAERTGTVSINDVRRVCDLDVLPPNAIGAIFRDKRFQQCGTTEAEHVKAHARIIRVYRAKENNNA
jgi:hypothetical protein